LLRSNAARRRDDELFPHASNARAGGELGVGLRDDVGVEHERIIERIERIERIEQR